MVLAEKLMSVAWVSKIIELFIARYDFTYLEFFNTYPEMLEKPFVCQFCTVVRTILVVSIFWIFVGGLCLLIPA